MKLLIEVSKQKNDIDENILSTKRRLRVYTVAEGRNKMTHQATSKKTTQVENIFADVTFRVDKETPACVYHCERGNK